MNMANIADNTAKNSVYHPKVDGEMRKVYGKAHQLAPLSIGKVESIGEEG